MSEQWLITEAGKFEDLDQLAQRLMQLVDQGKLNRNVAENLINNPPEEVEKKPTAWSLLTDEQLLKKIEWEVYGREDEYEATPFPELEGLVDQVHQVLTDEVDKRYEGQWPFGAPEGVPWSDIIGTDLADFRKKWFKYRENNNLKQTEKLLRTLSKSLDLKQITQKIKDM